MSRVNWGETTVFLTFAPPARVSSSSQKTWREPMQTISRAVACAAALGCANLACGIGARDQDYPPRPITMIVPFPAGGPTDTLGRVLGEGMRVSFGQPIVVENVTGAGSTIGVTRAAQAAPDGYTLALGNWTSFVGSGALYRTTYDLLRDFEPVSLLTFAPMLIVGKNALPVKDARELIAWLKTNPDKASVASGPGHFGRSDSPATAHRPRSGDRDARAVDAGGARRSPQGRDRDWWPIIRAANIKVEAN